MPGIYNCTPKLPTPLLRSSKLFGTFWNSLDLKKCNVHRNTMGLHGHFQDFREFGRRIVGNAGITMTRFTTQHLSSDPQNFFELFGINWISKSAMYTGIPWASMAIFRILEIWEEDCWN
jgi:hypothetical protein